jgi:hypothetical protein
VYFLLSFTLPPAYEDNDTASKDISRHEWCHLSWGFPADRRLSCHGTSDKPAGFASFSVDILWVGYSVEQVFHGNLYSQDWNGWTK